MTLESIDDVSNSIGEDQEARTVHVNFWPLPPLTLYESAQRRKLLLHGKAIFELHTDTAVLGIRLEIFPNHVTSNKMDEHGLPIVGKGVDYTRVCMLLYIF